MSRIWRLLHRRMVWTTGAALLAIAAAPPLMLLMLKVLNVVKDAYHGLQNYLQGK